MKKNILLLVVALLATPTFAADAEKPKKGELQPAKDAEYTITEMIFIIGEGLQITRKSKDGKIVIENFNSDDQPDK